MILTAITSVSLNPQIINREGYILKIYPNSEVAELIIKSGITFDDVLARDSKNTLEQARPGHKYYLLVSSEGFFHVTRKARKLGASKKFSCHLAAIACYTSNPSLALLGELYNKINKPTVTTKVFHSKETALEWLHEQTSKIQAA